jgi:hypothetical protein
MSLSQLQAQTVFSEKEIEFQNETGLTSAIVRTYDGGMLVCTRTQSPASGLYYITFLKLQVSGNIQWQTRIGPLNCNFRNIVQCVDSGFVVSGPDPTCVQCIRMIRIDQNGNVMFNQKIFFPGKSVGGNVYTMPKNNNSVYTVAALLDTVTFTNSWHVMEVDVSGIVIWSKGYHTTNGKTVIEKLDTCSNGDIMVLGSWYNTLLQAHGPMVDRLSANGALVWSKRYTSGSIEVRAHSMAKLNGDTFLIASKFIHPINGTTGMGALMIDGGGAVIWSARYQGMPFQNGDAIGLPNGEVCAIGGDQNNSALIKLDINGNLLCSRVFALRTFTSLDTLNGNEIIVTGISTLTSNIDLIHSSTCGLDCADSNYAFVQMVLPVQVSLDSTEVNVPYTVITDSLPLPDAIVHINEVCSTVGITDPLQTTISAFYPNPSSGLLHVISDQKILLIEIWDVYGRTCGKFEFSSTACHLDISNLSPGYYSVLVSFEAHIESRRLIIE